ATSWRMPTVRGQHLASNAVTATCKTAASSSAVDTTAGAGQNSLANSQRSPDGWRELGQSVWEPVERISTSVGASPVIGSRGAVYLRVRGTGVQRYSRCDSGFDGRPNWHGVGGNRRDATAMASLTSRSMSTRSPDGAPFSTPTLPAGSNCAAM